MDVRQRGSSGEGDWTNNRNFISKLNYDHHSDFTPKDTKLYYLPHGLGFLGSHRGSNIIFHAHCLLTKKLVAGLIVTGEGGAETIADNKSKTIQYIFTPRGII